MQVEKVTFADAHSFSPFFLDYIWQKDSLRPFYNHFPSLTAFKEQIKEKSSFPKANRKILVDTLREQYKDVPAVDAVKNNITSLSEDRTFTVTTGHQLNLCTGPLYFIYKIVTVINACKQLRKVYPECRFVPIYWMASEDHDFEEISYFRLYGKKYTWQTDQSGAVGRFDPRDVGNLLKEVSGDTKLFQDAYGKHSSLSAAVRHYVNALFGDEGLVTIDADHRALKNILKEVIADDVFRNKTCKLVDESDAQLESAGYKPSVNARDINFFYLDKGLRGRIEQTGEQFSIVDSKLVFSKNQLEKMINEEPEKFSPNVILRPLYQESILPNLAYIGGPAEVVYWMQLKKLFENYAVPFPILMPRNFALVIDAPNRRKFEKTGLEIKDLFEEKNYLFNLWVAKNTQNDLTLGAELKTLQSIFDQVKSRAVQVDETLGALVSAEAKQAIDRLGKIEFKMLKAEKRRHAEKLKQIEVIKDTLFPLGSLQERTDNFLNFYQQDPGFIKKLVDCLNPFDFQFHILTYDE